MDLLSLKLEQKNSQLKSMHTIERKSIVVTQLLSSKQMLSINAGLNLYQKNIGFTDIAYENQEIS